MTIDVARLIGAVNRELTSREHEGRPARVLVASRTFDTTEEDLWDALTNPERLPRWFLPVSGDFRLGGRYQIEGNASGEISACDPPRRLGLTWGMHGQVSWVNVDLSKHANGGTLLRLEHIAHVPDDLWDQYGPGAVGVGWDLSLMGLGLHLATGESNDPAEAEKWSVGPQGKEFVRAAVDDWARAAIAGGDDEASARAAADATFAFYTTPPEA